MDTGFSKKGIPYFLIKFFYNPKLQFQFGVSSGSIPLSPTSFRSIRVYVLVFFRLSRPGVIAQLAPLVVVGLSAPPGVIFFRPTPPSVVFFAFPKDRELLRACQATIEGSRKNIVMTSEYSKVVEFGANRAISNWVVKGPNLGFWRYLGDSFNVESLVDNLLGHLDGNADIIVNVYDVTNSSNSLVILVRRLSDQVENKESELKLRLYEEVDIVINGTNNDGYMD
ncbi:hypothetical protein V2J09_021113 [Rumex salicifolius]